ncbi:MAG TPA: transposase [Candidatus Limnocylindrales bacterium]|nr:transposase [Candidatus Limnocylindrales bacterium]
MVDIRSRGRLPHWEEKSAIYFVTFRLADSIPQQALRQIELEREDIVRTPEAAGRRMSPSEQDRLAVLHSEKIEAFLDAGAGACSLANPKVARLVVNSIRHFSRIRYRIFAWCVMPNHVHVVFRPTANNGLAEILHSWKSYSSRLANEILMRSGVFWAREYYDHLVRDENDLRRVVHYVLENPSKAGLKDWPWVGTGFER